MKPDEACKIGPSQRSEDMTETSRSMQQVSLGLSLQAGELVTAAKAGEETQVADLIAMQSSLLSSSPTWPYDTYRQGCPYPMVVPQSHLYSLEVLHTLLTSAITNIVERWWTDEEARLPERMPLEKYEEDVLRWMASQSRAVVPQFRECQGSWRPDFLLESPTGQYRVCEINGRFAFNAYLHTAFGQQAHIDMDNNIDPLAIPAVEPKKILDSLLSLFDPSLPLHLLKGEEPGLDIHLFISYVHSITGRKPRLIKPSDLRLASCSLSPTGYTLECVTRLDPNGNEVLERVHQVGLELHQRELRSLSTSLLREICLRCFNDFRTIFLVHDKRMLGIVLQELDSLVHVQRILSPSQAETLRRGITMTINPGSRELAILVKLTKICPRIKDDFILKPIRSGKGAGIVFGSDLSPLAWSSHLELLQKSALVPGLLTYVVQRKIEQPRFDVFLHKPGGLQRNYLVGTYMAVHGRYVGIGTWRTSPDRVCAVSHGGAWICSIVPAGSTDL